MVGQRGSDSLTLIIWVLGYLLFKRPEPNLPRDRHGAERNVRVKYNRPSLVSNEQ